MNYLHLTQTLAESFSALADEVQSLIDRKTILEHKLRYAREQVRTDTILHFFPQCARNALFPSKMMITLALDLELLLSRQHMETKFLYLISPLTNPRFTTLQFASLCWSSQAY